MILKVLSVFFIVTICTAASFSRPERMVGGVLVPYDVPSYSASLQNNSGYHVCGGAIISERAILTAAHCFIGAQPEHVTVMIGTNDLTVGGRKYSVTTIDSHTDYNITTRENDIAIVWTANDMKFSDNVKKIRLPSMTMDISYDESILLTGFGAIEPNGDSSTAMHALQLKVLDQETCRYAMRLTRNVLDSMFCTFTAIGEGTCHGDSGGPLVQGDALVGLVSWGIPCAVGFPDVHTRVGFFLPWIRDKLHAKNL